jgi:hypothetical protein
MKGHVTGLVTILLCSTIALAQPAVMDGNAAEAEYVQVAVQGIQTGFGDNDMPEVDMSNGSELDAAYAYIDDCTLYIVLSGNLHGFNWYELFFDTIDGEGQNRLLGNSANSMLNRMGDDGSGNGLTFDAGFAPDYWLSVNVGNNPNEIYVHYAEIRPGGYSEYTGQAFPVNTTNGGEITGGDNRYGILCTLDNSNIAGVAGGSGIDDNGGDVTTGVELAIPLMAIGVPTADFQVCAFVNGVQHDFMCNQSLDPLRPTDNLGEPRAVDFGDPDFVFFGDQFFTIPVTDFCGACCLVDDACVMTNADDCAALDGTFAGAGTNCEANPNPCTGIETGACCLGFASDSCIETTPGDCDFQGGRWIGGFCGPDVCPLGACCVAETCSVVSPAECTTMGGTYIGDDTDCSNDPCIVSGCCLDDYCVEIPGYDCIFSGGTPGFDCATNPCGAPDGQPVVDGTVDDSLAGVRDVFYGDALAVQTITTGFGDNADPDVGTADGSELDQAFGVVVGERLYLVLAGNLQSNFNKLEIFIDSIPGGQNQLAGDNPDIDFNGLNRLGDDLNTPETEGLIFDAGFEADYYLTFGGGNDPYALYANYAEVMNGGVANYLGNTSAASNGVLVFGTNPTGVLATINNSNVAGVQGDGGSPDSGAGVFTGLELSIALSDIGNPTGDIKVCAFINGSGHDFASNQWLAPLPELSDNPGEPRAIDLTTFDGDQFFIVPFSGGFAVGDMNCDGVVSPADIDPFVIALTQGQAGYEALFPDCDYFNGDTNMDGLVSAADIDPFVQLLVGP